MLNRICFCTLFLLSFFFSSAQSEAEDTLLISDSSVQSVIKPGDVDEDSYEADDDEEGAPIVDTLTYREVPDSTAAAIRKQKAFAYANDPRYWVKAPPKPITKGFWDYFDDFFRNNTVRILFYVFLACLLVFALYKIIVTNDLYIFQSSSRKKKALVFEGEEGIEDENLDEKIGLAVQAGDYRLATRFLYLKSLKLLNQKGWIHYSVDATNRDYLRQTSSTPVSREFKDLTRAYEYVWYGEFQLQQGQFEILQNNFKNLYASIR